MLYTQRVIKTLKSLSTKKLVAIFIKLWRFWKFKCTIIWYNFETYIFLNCTIIKYSLLLLNIFKIIKRQLLELNKSKNIHQLVLIVITLEYI